MGWLQVINGSGDLLPRPETHRPNLHQANNIAVSTQHDLASNHEGAAQTLWMLQETAVTSHFPTFKPPLSDGTDDLTKCDSRQKQMLR